MLAPRRFRFPAVALALTLATLSASPADGDDAAEEPAAFDAFGEALTLEDTTPLARVLAEPERYDAAPVLVRGRLTDVCQKKGCWTVIQDGEARARVRFKDYGFFLPKDASGRVALVEGIASVRTLSERDARHYEEEGRNGNPDAIRGPQREVGLIASGVRLFPRQK